MDYPKKALTPSAEDQARINRLVEEALSRSKELKMIFARILGAEFSSAEAGNPPSGATQMQISGGKGGKFTITFDDGSVACWDYEGNTCSSGPC